MNVKLASAGILALGVFSLILTSSYSLPTENMLTEKAIGTEESLSGAEESLFAEIDESGNVLRVIVVTPEVINSGAFGDPKNWVRTYADGRNRGKYAGKGDVYAKDLDTFATSTESLKNMRKP